MLGFLTGPAFWLGDWSCPRELHREGKVFAQGPTAWAGSKPSIRLPGPGSTSHFTVGRKPTTPFPGFWCRRGRRRKKERCARDFWTPSPLSQGHSHPDRAHVGGWVRNIPSILGRGSGQECAADAQRWLGSRVGTCSPGAGVGDFGEGDFLSPEPAARDGSGF